MLPVCGWWPSLIRKPSTSRPFFSAAGCCGNVVVGRDRARVEAGDRRHDLEHRARHVAAQRRARQERVGVVGLERRERRRRPWPGRRSRTRRRSGVEARASTSPVVGSSITTAPRSLPRPSTAARWSRRSSVSLEAERLARASASNLSSRPPNGSAPDEAEQLRVVRALQAGRPVLARGVADDVADRVVAVLADAPRRSCRARCGRASGRRGRRSGRGARGGRRR